MVAETYRQHEVRHGEHEAWQQREQLGELLLNALIVQFSSPICIV
jgi:hypothetical protein